MSAVLTADDFLPPSLIPSITVGVCLYEIYPVISHAKEKAARTG
jgi:hypothetical protein